MTEYISQQVALLRDNFSDHIRFKQINEPKAVTQNTLKTVKAELLELGKQSVSLMEQNLSLHTQLKKENSKLKCLVALRKALKEQVEKLKKANSNKEAELRKTLKEKERVLGHIDHFKKRIATKNSS